MKTIYIGDLTSKLDTTIAWYENMRKFAEKDKAVRREHFYAGGKEALSYYKKWLIEKYDDKRRNNHE